MSTHWIRLVSAAASWIIHGLIFSPLIMPIQAQDQPDVPPLTSAAEVRALSPEEAARSLPVRLTAVVLAPNRIHRAIVIQDGTDGLYVKSTRDVISTLQVGDWIELEGVTDPGDFAPIVVGTSVRKLGTQPIPPPIRTTLADIATGGFDARWVEVEGVIRDYKEEPYAIPASPTDGDEMRGSSSVTVSSMIIASGSERIQVRCLRPLNGDALVDARVRLRGVCFNIHNANRQFVSANLQIISEGNCEILTPPPSDPFELPLSRATELLQFNRQGFTGHRVHVRGVVTHHATRDALWIRDGERGLRVDSVQAGEVVPGDEVEVAGFADPGNYSPSLADAVFRRVATGASPSPIFISKFRDAIAHESDLVEIEAVLADIDATPAGTILTLHWGKSLIQADLANAARNTRPDWTIGSTVRARGICVLAPAGAVPRSGLWQAGTFRLLLRNDSDIDLVQLPPWLNAQRVQLLIAITASLLLLLAIGLGLQSRRRLALQAAERKTAETEFAAMLRERNRMAREIHDTLAQGLNAVSMQLELARNAATENPDGVLRHVETAHAIVRSCSAEARDSIWNMRSHVLERTDLAGALRGVLQQLGEGLPIETEFTATGPAVRLANTIENNLLRIGQEAVANALKHARPTRISVSLDFAPHQIRLQICDNGGGFDVASSRRTGSRFGLAGMRERSEQMEAQLTVKSEPGRGTTITVEVPRITD